MTKADIEKSRKTPVRLMPVDLIPTAEMVKDGSSPRPGNRTH